MRTGLFAVVVGLAIGVASLGVFEPAASLDKNASAAPESVIASGVMANPTPLSPVGAFPKSHGDANSDSDEAPLLNQNINDGESTTVCTRGTNPHLLRIMNEGVRRWNDALGDDLGFNPFVVMQLAKCAGTDIEVTEGSISVD